MTSPTEKRREIAKVIYDALGRGSTHDEEVIARALAKSEREGMKRAAEIIRDGVERPVSVAYRMDGKPSKNDKCPHDFYVYEDCEECCVAAILSEAGEG